MRSGVVSAVSLLIVAILLLPGSSARASHLSTQDVRPNTPLTAPLISFANPYSTGMSARDVIGAPNLTSRVTGHGPSAFGGVAEFPTFDAKGDLWVSDPANNRVLEFVPPFVPGMSASLVLGQSDFSGTATGRSAVNLSDPTGLAFDPRGDLWISDTGNNRVLEFLAPFHSGMAASRVIGQSVLTTGDPGVGPTSLDGPQGIAFNDGTGDLWVADTVNNRVVEFPSPLATGEAANLVLGQVDLASRVASATSTGLNAPADVAIDPTTFVLWVADSGNNRALGYPAQYATGQAASYLIGQTAFGISNSTGGPALLNPSSVFASSGNILWVSDSGKNRVVEFSYFGTFATPAVVLGQNSSSGTLPGLSRSNLSQPVGASVDPVTGSLWVCDGLNHRIVAYVPPVYLAVIAESGLPGGTTWGGSIDGAAFQGTGSLLSVPVSNGSHLLILNRIGNHQPDPAFEGFAISGAGVVLPINFSTTPGLPFATGMAASLVLGQSSLFSVVYGPVTNASNLKPWLTTFDRAGDLWVSDLGHNRVLEFVPPFSTNMNATLVLGQTNFSGFMSGVGPANLTRPEGVRFDTSGDLWVACEGSGRVVEFVPPFHDGMNPTTIIGQPAFGPSNNTTALTNLTSPVGITFDRVGDLWVTDFHENRVTRYAPPFTDGEAASMVLGQSTLLGTGAGTSAVNLSAPQAIEFDALGDAWVSDWYNDRALEFRAPLSTGEGASVVLGQPNFTTSSSIGPNSFGVVGSLVLDPSGNVWVTDYGKSRVLEFLGPTFTDYQTPAVAIGAPNISDPSLGSARGPVQFFAPMSAVFDANGDLWVNDLGDARLLEFVPIAASTSASSIPAWEMAGIGAVVLIVAIAGVVLWRARKKRPSPLQPASVPPAAAMTSTSPGPPASPEPWREEAGGPGHP